MPPPSQNTVPHKSAQALQAAFHQATQLYIAGRLADARKAYAEILKSSPNHAGCLNNLGLVLYDEGNYAEAESIFTRALGLSGDDAANKSNVLSNLGNLAKLRGDLARAAAFYEQSLAARPDNAGTHVNLGNVYQSQGNAERAIGCYDRAIVLDPKLPEAHLNRGSLLHRLDRLVEAATSFERAIALRPDYPDAYNNLGITLCAMDLHDQAGERFAAAMRLKPNYIDAYLNVGNMLKGLGRGEEANAYFERILVLDPDHLAALSNIAFSLNYSDTVDGATLADRHFRSGAQIERRFRGLQPNHQNVHDPRRKLRVGYVSPDFRLHAVASFFEPLLGAHDRAAVEVFCYAEVFAPDAVTARLKGLADHWLSTVGMSDDALAAKITADRIDILVDLAGYSNNHRLATFARRPAPVQMTWLGYPNTTGLTAMDYRLVDAVTDPPGVADSLATEKLIRLEGGFHCYRPIADAPEPLPPPCLEAGYVTFGCFNNQPKLSPPTFDTWAKLLARVPDARIVLKNHYLGAEGARTAVLARFVERGVAPDRVTLLRGLPELSAHLAAYRQIDIALDSFPYNGTTTTCEALWMGVPVVTLAGDRHLARVGASLLAHVGVGELVAPDRERYVDIAAALAGDKTRLAAYHAELRNRFTASALCDAGGFARKIEAAYRAAWQNWCAVGPVAAPAASDASPVPPVQRPLAQEPPPALTKNAAEPTSQATESRMSRKQRRAEKSAKGHGNFVQAFNQALALQQTGEFAAAEAGYRKAMVLNPNVALLYNNLGVVLYDQGKFDDAIVSQRRAIGLDPALAMAHNNLGVALNALGNHAEAMPAFRRAIELDPGNAQAFNNLGDSFVKLSRFAEGAEMLKRAVALRPTYVEAQTNLGAAYWGLGRLEEAVTGFRRAIELDPTLAMAHKNLGIVSLLAGHYADGWREYEWRWVADKIPLRNHPKPLWQGQDLGESKLFVWGEQGVGDQVLHASMMADLSARGLNVVWETDPRLVALLKRSYPDIRVVARGVPPPLETIAADVGAHLPAGSLGQYLRSGESHFPTGRQSYLQADTERAARLRAGLGLQAGEKLVGLSWLSLHPDYGQSKSVALAALGDVLRTPGLRFVDMQYNRVQGLSNDTAAERAAIAQSMGVEIAHVDGLDLCDDLDGVAALAAACDLVVTVSNTTAHIAAALGRPVWIMMPAGIGKFWYWGQGSSTLWYPTVRLFRQPDSQDWTPTLRALAEEAQRFANR